MGRIYLSIGVQFFMNHKSSGNYHGFTGRNEHGDPHIIAKRGNNIVEVYIKDGRVKSIKSGEYTPHMKEQTENFLHQYKERLLNMWTTQNFEKIKNIKYHK